jgi:WhiB family transcriptional regulator, redox-sensing transcriptional regulator
MHDSASTMTSQDGWRAQGACRQEDPELFFPLGPAGPGLLQLARAKAVCARCQARAGCLQFAVETGQDYGVWGGMSEEERRVLRRDRARRARTAAAAQPRQDERRPARAG